MWSGFSSEIETSLPKSGDPDWYKVACGAASRLRLKQDGWPQYIIRVNVACGAASRLRLKRYTGYKPQAVIDGRMWSGFSSEIET